MDNIFLVSVNIFSPSNSSPQQRQLFLTKIFSEAAVTNLEKLQALDLEFDLVYSSTPTYLVDSIPFLKRLYCLSNRLFNPITMPPLIIREILVTNIAIKIIGVSFTSCAYSSTCL